MSDPTIGFPEKCRYGASLQEKILVMERQYHREEMKKMAAAAAPVHQHLFKLDSRNTTIFLNREEYADCYRCECGLRQTYTNVVMRANPPVVSSLLGPELKQGPEPLKPKRLRRIKQKQAS